MNCTTPTWINFLSVFNIHNKKVSSALRLRIKSIFVFALSISSREKNPPADLYNNFCCYIMKLWYYATAHSVHSRYSGYFIPFWPADAVVLDKAMGPSWTLHSRLWMVCTYCTCMPSTSTSYLENDESLLENKEGWMNDASCILYVHLCPNFHKKFEKKICPALMGKHSVVLILVVTHSVPKPYRDSVI